VFDHDDISLPQRLEKEVRYLDEHPEIGVVSGQLDYFLQKKTSKHPEVNEDIKRSLMFADVVAHTAMMVRKSVLDKFGIRYEEEYSPAEDYMICLRLVKYTMFYNFQEALVRYRNFAGNTTNNHRGEMKNADALCRCFAAREYPYFFQPKKAWVKLFGIIPLLKIKRSASAIKVYLLGFVLLVSTKC
jgi:hypothetical protein